MRKYLWQVRWQYAGPDGIVVYMNGETFRRRQDAVKHLKLHYKAAAQAEVVRIAM